jgi:hypothetical protein
VHCRPASVASPQKLQFLLSDCCAISLAALLAGDFVRNVTRLFNFTLSLETNEIDHGTKQTGRGCEFSDSKQKSMPKELGTFDANTNTHGFFGSE